MGDARKDALRVEFDSRIKLEFHGATVTSDAGLEAAFSCNARLFKPVAGRKSACGASNSTGGGIMVLEWPGGGVGRTVSGKCRVIEEELLVFCR